MASSPPSLDNPSSISEAGARTSDFIEGKVDGESVLITDPDLIEQVKAAPASMRAVITRMASRTQDERNKTQERRESMTPIQRRRDVVKEQISENPIDKEDIYHIHSVLGLCALPYRKLPDGKHHYTREYGKMSLTVQAGFLKDPEDGKMIMQGLPYGTKARLLQLHICTRALRQQSPEVELEESMSAFIRSVGFEVTGGKKGTINLFKEQLQRLAACNMTLGFWDGHFRAKTIKANPIESFDVWFPDNPDQKMLWPSRVTLSQKFYDSLRDHALPVDIRIYSALSQSARQMDIVLWLAYRLKSVRQKYFLTWDILKEQFCQSSTHRLDHFQKEFKKDLAQITEALDPDKKQFPIQPTEKGIFLFPVDPDCFLVPPKKLLKL
jgi:hypothetical protein